ncbi:MAG: GNAT family N-acetyltransferase [Janthinobacterium lividum]
MTLAAGAPSDVALKLQIGARTIASVRRRLSRVPLSLSECLANDIVMVPPVPANADGLLISSLPVERLATIGTDGCMMMVRQRYVRSWADLSIGYDRWWQRLSAQARSGLGRKARRLGAKAEVRRYASADEVATFLPMARDIARTTYQERLLDAALPNSSTFVTETLERAARDEVRGWLLFVEASPAAYLFCTVQPDGRGDTLRYDHLGYDPAHAGLSPGSILQMAAWRDLMAEGRFARFDFLEGDGRHKRLFATHGVDCCDVLLLRRTIANRAILATLAAFDAAVTWAGRSERLRRWTRIVRR